MTSVFARICIGVIAPSVPVIPIQSAKTKVTPMSVATGRTKSLTLPSSRVGKFRSASPGTGPWEASHGSIPFPVTRERAAQIHQENRCKTLEVLRDSRH